MSDENQDAMKQSLDAAATPPRPKVGNVAAGLRPRPQAAAKTQPKAVKDELGCEVACNLAFLGTGQGGGRLANSFYNLGYRRVAAFNTTEADFKDLAEGMNKLSLDTGGSAKDTHQAEEALSGREDEVWDLLVRTWGTEVDYGLVTIGLGGGTGSGTSEQLVKLARRYLKENCGHERVGAVVSLPTVTEGFQVCRNAVAAFQALDKLNVAPLIVIDNARIHELYRPSMTKLHETANSAVSSMLHLFNQLSAIHSPFITFDQAELRQLLDGGIITMGAADVQKFDSPADVTSAIREQLSGNVLAQVDLGSGDKAACLFVGAQDVLDSLDMDYFEAGFSQMDRTLGEDSVVHRGVYLGDEPGLQVYVMFSGLAHPAKRLRELAAKGGLLNSKPGSSLAGYLGVDDA